MKLRFDPVVTASIASAVVSFLIGYQIGKNIASAEYDERLNEERRRMWELIAKSNKKGKGNKKVPRDTHADISNAEPNNSLDHSKENFSRPNRQSEPRRMIMADPRPEIKPRLQDLVQEFDSDLNDTMIVEDDGFDYAEEMKHRSSEDPYIISLAEWDANEHGYDKYSLLYFMQDDVLSDEVGYYIDGRELVVGEDTLERFGHGSKDPNVVYVCHEDLETLFEITRIDANYMRDTVEKHNVPEHMIFETDDETDGESAY